MSPKTSTLTWKPLVGRPCAHIRMHSPPFLQAIALVGELISISIQFGNRVVGTCKASH